MGAAADADAAQTPGEILDPASAPDKMRRHGGG